MNASNTTSLSSGSTVVSVTNPLNWSMSFGEMIYFGLGFGLGCIFAFLVFLLRAKCKNSPKKQKEEDSGHML